MDKVRVSLLLWAVLKARQGRRVRTVPPGGLRTPACRRGDAPSKLTARVVSPPEQRKDPSRALIGVGSREGSLGRYEVPADGEPAVTILGRLTAETATGAVPSAASALLDPGPAGVEPRSGESPAGPLGNLTNSSSAITGWAPAESPETAEQRRATRAEKYAFRRQISTLTRAVGALEHRVVTCGLKVHSAFGVGVRLTGGQAGFSGLALCASAWSCPVCAAKIAAQRAEELGDVLAWARGEGHALAMVTLTVQHHQADALVASWDAVADGWAAVTSGSQWTSEPVEKFAQRLADWRLRGRQADADKAAGLKVRDGGQRAPKGWNQGVEPVRRVGDMERFGVIGWARVIEVTHGENGWHPHLHVPVIMKRGGNIQKRAKELGDAMFERWQRAVQLAGFDSWRDSGGLDVTVTGAAEKKLAEYLTKSADPVAVVRAAVGVKARKLALEATMGHAKKARSNKGRNPFQIAADAIATGDPKDVQLWAEWVEVSTGRRQWGWSAGLREMAGLAAEAKTDEEITAEELGTEEDTVLFLPSSSWWRVADRSFELLDVVEREGVQALRDWLDARGVVWIPPQWLLGEHDTDDALAEGNTDD